MTSKNKELMENLKLFRKTLGPIPSPYDCYNTIRGIKTLTVRMDKHCASVKKIADFLDNHEKVDKVYYPGLSSHPGHEIAKKQMKDFGGVVSFEVKGDYKKFAKTIASQKPPMIYLTESLGGVESLMTHPTTMSHGYLSPEGRADVGIKDNLLRLSPGMEDVDDLIDGLEKAFDAI